MAEQLCPACGCHIAGSGYESEGGSIAASPAPAAARASAVAALFLKNLTIRNRAAMSTW